MSLIDTVALGRMSDALQLAALGPASLLLTFSNYILFGLSVGTVSLIATALKAKDTEAASRALSSSLFLAACGGATMAAVFLQWGSQLLRLTGAEPAVLAYAAVYLRIRALALPAVLTVQASPGRLAAARLLAGAAPRPVLCLCLACNNNIAGCWFHCRCRKRRCWRSGTA